MEKVKILWSGITGRTGREAKKKKKNSDTVEITAGLSRSNTNYYNYDLKLLFISYYIRN